MKIVLWLGNEANQKALANKINSVHPVAGIVTESRKHKTKLTASKLFEKVIEKLFLGQIGKAWWGMKSYYDAQYHAYPATKLIDTENINSQEAFDFTSQINPDLIIVSGTRLIKKNMFLLNPGIGILNLHTGLSPYIKGGPNCTNWCIATKQYHLIGNTLMWIDAGIDTGNIVTTHIYRT
jgi:methionyl-tRNA formyltransferase